MTTHIFVYVVKRRDDPFLGIKYYISRKLSDNSIVDVRLSNSDYNLINDVEYSWRRYVRFLYYRNIFVRLQQLIEQAVVAKSDNFIYLSDEGLWGVFLNTYLKKSLPKFTSINVQHGYFGLSGNDPVSYYRHRKIINRLVYFFLRGPAFGYGFGGAEFDIYLCYGTAEAQWLRKVGNKKIHICLDLIKWGLIARYSTVSESNDTSNVVFMLPASVPGSAFSCNLEQFLDKVTPLVKYLKINFNSNITLRLHPGNDFRKDKIIIENSRIANIVSIDREEDIINTLACHPVVFSAHSTALFEAHVLGRCAIALSSSCYNRKISYLDRILYLDSEGWRDDLHRFIDSWDPRKPSERLDIEECCDLERILIDTRYAEHDVT